jgi:hypothetical protein
LSDDTFLAARRIRSGDVVGDQFLWGRLCIEMQEAHGITDAQLAPYRSALFFADKDMVDESGALEREARRKELHEVARQRIWEGQRGGRHVPEVGGENIA